MYRSALDIDQFDGLRHCVGIFPAALHGFEAQAGAVQMRVLWSFVGRHLCDIWSGQGASLSGAGVFTRADLIRLAARLSEIAGKFLLSVNDVSEMREAFTRFGIESAATRYTASSCKGIDVAKIVVTGPSPDAVLPARDLSSL
jgi:hypothetical protein